MFKEPVLVVKSRRGSLQQQEQLSGSLVSAVFDSTSSTSPRIYPLDPGYSVELVDNSNSLQHPLQNHNKTHYNNHKNQNSYQNNINGHPPQRSKKPNELCLVPATAPPYPHHSPLGTLDSGVTSATSSTGTSLSPTPYSSEKAKEAHIVPESNGIGRRLLNGFYDEFLDGLPFRRQPASTYCDPPARRYSLMGRAGTARNSEFKRNPIAQHRQR